MFNTEKSYLMLFSRFQFSCFYSVAVVFFILIGLSSASVSYLEVYDDPDFARMGLGVEEMVTYTESTYNLGTVADDGESFKVYGERE